MCVHVLNKWFKFKFKSFYLKQNKMTVSRQDYPKTLHRYAVHIIKIRLFYWLRALCASCSLHFCSHFELFIDSSVSDTPVRVSVVPINAELAVWWASNPMLSWGKVYKSLVFFQLLVVQNPETKHWIHLSLAAPPEVVHEVFWGSWKYTMPRAGNKL
jgi:hypothetical protein